LVVAGGDDTEIAEAIEVHKTPGTGTFGDTTELVYDNNGMPINISFQRAVTATIDCRITISTGEGWSSDFEALIQAEVAGVINAGRIGAPVLLTKLYAPAYLSGSVQGQTYDVTKVELKKNAGVFAEANVVLDFDENPVCDPDADVILIIT